MQPSPQPDNDVASLIEAVARGRSSAAEQLLPLVYKELRALAAGYLAAERDVHTLQPTALVHEAYLKLAGSRGAEWAGRAHFCAVAARAMRQVLVNHARSRGAKKRGGGAKRVTLIDVVSPAPAEEVDVEALDNALNELERVDERQCRIVELRFLAGMSVADTARVLKVSPRTIELEWRMAKARLRILLDEKGA